MANPSITIPNVDPDLVRKLQAAVTALESANGKFKSGSSGISSTNTSVNNAVGAIAANSAGLMVVELAASYWPNTQKDGNKAHSALTELATHLDTLKGTITEQLPAIQTGMAAIQTAKQDQVNSTKLDQKTADDLQGKINGLITALSLITSAAGPASTKIGGISIGGACATGIQPGGKVPDFENTLLMAKKGNKVNLVKAGAGGAAKQVASGEPSAVAKILAKFLGPGLRGVDRMISKLPGPVQKVLAGLTGGSANTFTTGATSGPLSPITLTSLLTNVFGSWTGATVQETLALAGVTNPSAIVTLASIAGGIGIGSTITFIIKPLVLDHILPKKHTPPPTIVVKRNPQTGDVVTTVIQNDGSTETIDVKPNGSEVITQKNADGSQSTRTVPAPSH